MKRLLVDSRQGTARQNSRYLDAGTIDYDDSDGYRRNMKKVSEDYAFPSRDTRGKYLALPAPPRKGAPTKTLTSEYIVDKNHRDKLPEPTEFSNETIEIAKKIIKLSKPQRIAVPIPRSRAIDIARRIWRLGRCMNRVVYGGTTIHDPLDPTRPIDGEMKKAVQVLKIAGVSEYSQTLSSWKLAYKLMGTIFRDNFTRY